MHCVSQILDVISSIMSLEEHTNLLKTRNYPTQDVRVLDNEETRKLSNYVYLGQSLILSRRALSELIVIMKAKVTNPAGSEASTIELGLFCSFVMFYCKIFTSNSSGKIVLNPKKLYKVDKQLSIHNEIDEYRNAFFAHSGDYKSESVVCTLVTENDKLSIETSVRFKSLPSINRLEEYQNHLTVPDEWLAVKSTRAYEAVSKSLGLDSEGGSYEKFS